MKSPHTVITGRLNCIVTIDADRWVRADLQTDLGLLQLECSHSIAAKLIVLMGRSVTVKVAKKKIVEIVND